MFYPPPLGPHSIVFGIKGVGVGERGVVEWVFFKSSVHSTLTIKDSVLRPFLRGEGESHAPNPHQALHFIIHTQTLQGWGISNSQHFKGKNERWFRLMLKSVRLQSLLIIPLSVRQKLIKTIHTKFRKLQHTERKKSI